MMDYTDRPKKFCKKLSHGMVLTSKCQRKCTFFCFPPYKSEDRVSFVNCDVTSQKWLTSSGKTPCVIKPGVTSTTKNYFDLDIPTHNDIFNMDDYKTIPTYKPFDFDFKVPTFKVPTMKPFDIDDDYNSNTTNESSNSAAVPGLIVAGIILLTILSVCTRLWVARINTRRRHQRVQSIQRLVEQLNSQTRSRTATQQRLPVTSPQNQTETNREQRLHVTPLQSPTEEAVTDQGNNNTGMFIVIRRIFRFPLSRNPYSTLQNPPSPPPYDAENVPPPAYEETEGMNTFSSHATNQPNGVGFSQSSQAPDDSPPPYTENI